MTTIMKCIIFVGVLQLCVQICYGFDYAPKPYFPSVFQVEVKGLFKDIKKEMEGTLYYDRLNNRGALHYTYDGITKRFIYRLDNNELLQISGTDCTVSNTKTDLIKQVFFPFLVYRADTTHLATADEFFFFTKSAFFTEATNFPSYIFKGKLNSPLYDGSNCDVTHVFTKPEVKVQQCDKTCQPTLSSINIICYHNDGSEKTNTQYDFFRFQSAITDSNVFMPPAGIFCNITSRDKFPGLPEYFSFSYDLTEDQKITSLTSVVHKKVWYDSQKDILRVDEFDGQGVLLASRVFDINAGIVYASIASLSTCETGIINSGIVPLSEMIKLPNIFFQGGKALNRAAHIGTRRIQGQDYEVWSLPSENKQKSEKIVQNFYFTKTVSKPGTPTNFKLSHAEIYTYQMNVEKKKSEPVISYLHVNNFIDKPRWEAFDVSSCFTKDQKKGFRLKVDGPPTMKDSKMFQEVLNQLYLDLVRATNISAIRLNDLTCVFDGVKIVEFTGRILDKPKVLSSDAGKYELDMNEAYTKIQYLANAGELSLKLAEDEQDIKYKITAIEDIKNDDEDKNLYSGGVVAALVFGITPLAMIVSAFIGIKIRKRQQGGIDSVEVDNSVRLTPTYPSSTPILNTIERILYSIRNIK